MRKEPYLVMAIRRIMLHDEPLLKSVPSARIVKCFACIQATYQIDKKLGLEKIQQIEQLPK